MPDRQPRPREDGGHLPVIVIGGGQAGLAISWHLKRQGVAHLVLEKHATGHAWRHERWDSFCLVTPNWQCQLPGFPYPGDDPDGFMLRDEIVAYLEAYRALVDPPLLEGVEVTGLTRDAAGRFAVRAGERCWTADEVVLAISGYHRLNVPARAGEFPPHVRQLHTRDYRNPAQLPPGAVLIVGTGQSGCQIAEDLHLAGRQVHLCVGGAPKSPRVYRGRDAIAWLHDLGYYAMPVERHPLKEAVRRKANHYLSGRDGGREIDLRRFAAEGMRLYGRLAGIAGPVLTLAPDLAKNLDAADASAAGIKSTIDTYIAEQGIAAPTEPPYAPPWRPAREETRLDLDAAGITTVIWGTGFRSDFGWIDLKLCDAAGYPTHSRGVTTVDGLYVVGLPWLHSWGSGRFSGIALDAQHIVAQIAARRAATRVAASPLLERLHA